MRHILRINGQDHAAALAGPPQSRRILLDNAKLTASLSSIAGSAAILTLEGRSTHLHIASAGDRFFIWHNGEVYEVDVLEPAAFHASHAIADGALETLAPMPGSVVAIPVSLGDMVRTGDTLVTIESMKLEVSLKATQPGQVTDIRCTVGGTFAKGAVLIALTAEGNP